MIGWTSVEAPRPVADARLVLAKMPVLESAGLAVALTESPCVCVTRNCWRMIRRHVGRVAVETGGLLLGHAFKASWTRPEPPAHLVLVTHAVPAPAAEATATSLRMDAELWVAARPHLDRGLAVAGWYHSHPGFGAFFSAVDRLTQAAFFAEPFSVGLVVDPILNQWAAFVGPGSCPVAKWAFVIGPFARIWGTLDRHSSSRA